MHKQLHRAALSAVLATCALVAASPFLPSVARAQSTTTPDSTIGEWGSSPSKKFGVQGLRRIVDKDVSTPPGSCTVGQFWIVGPDPTGVWALHEGHQARCTSALPTYAFHVPAAGWIAWVDDEDRLYTFDGSDWVEVEGGGGGGGGDAETSDPLSQFAATTSAQLAGVITNETGSGLLVFGTSPTLATPNLGTPTALTLTSATGLPLSTGVSGTLPIANGGTAAATASGARTALGLVIGTDVQAFDADLSTLAASTAAFLTLSDDASVSAIVDTIFGAASSGTGGACRVNSCTLTIPTIASLTNAQHSHQDAAGGGALSTAALTSGTMATARLGSGSATSSTFLRGDSTWQTIAGGGDALTTSPLSQFAATTSAELGGVLSDETGGNAFVRADSPTLTGAPVLANPTATTLTLAASGLHLLDTNASHDLIVNPGSDLTADHTLTLTTGDADRTLTISSSTTLGGGSHSGTNTGDQTITLTGPITGSGTGSFATTVADLELAAIAGLTSAADRGIVFTGSGTASLFTLTTAGLALLDDADASAQRTTLGLGTLATQSGTFSGTSSGTNTGDQTSVSGNAGTVTFADAGGDTTTSVALGTAATGSLAPATDSGLTYNATTNALTASGGFVGDLTGNAATATSATSATSATTATTATNVADADKGGVSISSGVWSVDTNANLTGPITSSGNATTIADGELSSIAGLTSAADALPYYTGSGTASTTTLTSAARTVLDDTTTAAMRTTLAVLGTAGGTLTGPVIVDEEPFAYSATPTLDTAAHASWAMSDDLDGAMDVTLSNVAAGTGGTIGVRQNATGGFSVTLTATGATMVSVGSADVHQDADDYSLIAYQCADVDTVLTCFYSLGGPASGGGDALTTDGLDQFAATTSAELAGVLSDETGSGGFVRATSPTLTTPVLGAASGTSLRLGTAGLQLGDTNDSHELHVTVGSDLTADRVFTLTTGDAARTLSVLDDVSLSDGDKGDITVASDFTSLELDANSVGSTELADTVALGDPTATTLTLNQSGLHLLDSDSSHDLIVNPGSNLTADRTLTITTGDAARTLTLTGDASITGTNTGDQTITLTGNVTGTGTGSFAATIASDVVAVSMMADDTDGSILTWDATGEAVLLAPGTAGQVLTTGGAGAAPTWEDAGGGSGNVTASQAAIPIETDDTGDGYVVGDRVCSTAADACFVALDVSSGAAVWRQDTRVGNERVRALAPYISNVVEEIGLVVATTGTVDTPALATTNMRTSLKRTNAADVAGGAIRTSEEYWWRGNASGLGGFDVEFTYAVSTAASGQMVACGLFDGTPGTPEDPETLLSGVWIGNGSADTNLRIMHNDSSGVATEVDLGSSFPAVSTTPVYYVRLYTPPNDSNIYYVVRRLDSAAVSAGSVSTNLPANTAFLRFFCGTSDTSGDNVGVDLMQFRSFR